MQVLIITEDSVNLQYNVTMYIQKSVSENSQNAVIGVENTTPHQTFCYQP